jgi:hypothetical protein
MIPDLPRPDLSKLPPSGLGLDGKLRRMTEEEQRLHIESVRQRLTEIAEMTDEDPPGAFEAFMRNFDEDHPHRPQFEGMS